MAHTPGPYIIAEPGGPAGPFYGLVNDKGNVVAMQILRRDDALLLHAAPDLLEACKGLLAFIESFSFGGDWCQDNYPAIKAAKAAIAEAAPAPAAARRQGE